MSGQGTKAIDVDCPTCKAFFGDECKNLPDNGVLMRWLPQKSAYFLRAT